MLNWIIKNGGIVTRVNSICSYEWIIIKHN